MAGYGQFSPTVHRRAFNNMLTYFSGIETPMSKYKDRVTLSAGSGYMGVFFLVGLFIYFHPRLPEL